MCANTDILFKKHESFTVEQAKEYLVILAKSDYAYHLDDSPHDQLNCITAQPTFTKEQADALDHNLELMAEAEHIGWDRVWEWYWSIVKETHGKEYAGD